MAEKMKKRIVVGATGASGLPLLIKCLEIIREKSDYESYLIMSSSAELTLRQDTETGRLYFEAGRDRGKTCQRFF